MSLADHQDPTLIVGLHGTFRLHPWLHQPLEEDVFSLVVKRTIAFGWSSFRGEKLGGQLRWGHNDAGDDWSAEDGIRQIAWVQVAAADDGDQRLPVLPLVVVLSDALSRVGSASLAGMHAIVPMHLATDSRSALASARDWFSLADPDTETSFTVSISAGPQSELGGKRAEIAELVRESSADGIGAVPSNAGQPGDGLAFPLAGETQQRNLVPIMYFHCTTHEWSADALAWVAESFVEAMRRAGESGRVLIAVSKDDIR